MSLAIKLPYLPGSSRQDEDRPVLGPERVQMVDALHGKHYTDALRGRVFSQSATPLGLAIPIYTATALAGSMPIWNPKGSGVNVELVSVSTARASGTADFGAIGLMGLRVDQSNLGTGAPITAFAETTPKNRLLGGGLGSLVKSSNAGTVTITAGAATDWIETLFTMNLEADTGTAHATTVARYDFDGTLVIPPGWLVYIAATKASVALFASSIVWKEIPV